MCSYVYMYKIVYAIKRLKEVLKKVQESEILRITKNLKLLFYFTLL